MMNVSVLIIRGFSGYLTLSVHFHKDSCCICFTALSFRRKGLILALWQSSWTHLPAPHTHTHPPKSPFKVRRQLCQTSFQFGGKALTPWCSDVLSLFLYSINKKKGWNSCPVRKLPHLASRSRQTGFIHCIKSQVWQGFLIFFSWEECVLYYPMEGTFHCVLGSSGVIHILAGPAWIACLFCFGFSPSTSPVRVAECSRKSLKRKKRKGAGWEWAKQFLVHNVYSFIL